MVSNPRPLAEGALRLAGRAQESIVDGPGLRYVIFTQGCPHRCEGCHNPDALDFSGGEEVPVSAILDEIAANPLLDGVTLSGGEPMEQAEALIPVARFARDQGLNIWLYSGYTYDQLIGEENPARSTLLALCDVLVDGPFVLAERSLTLDWRGSLNQRVIDLNRTRDAGKIQLYENPSYGPDYRPAEWK